MDVKLKGAAADSLLEGLMTSLAKTIAKQAAGGQEPEEAKVSEVFRDLLEGEPKMRLAVRSPETGMLQWLPGIQFSKFDLEQIPDFDEMLAEHYGSGKYSVGLAVKGKIRKVNQITEITGLEEKWRALLKRGHKVSDPHDDDDGEDTEMNKALEERAKAAEQELHRERDERRRLETEFQRQKDDNLKQSLVSQMATMQVEQARQMTDMAAKFQASIDSLKATAQSAGGGTANQIAEAIKAAAEAFKSHQTQDPAAMFTAAAKVIADLIPKPQVNALEGVVEVINTIAKVSDKLGLVPAGATVPAVPSQSQPGSWIRDLSGLFENFSKAVSVAKEAEAEKKSAGGNSEGTPPDQPTPAATHQEAVAQGISRLMGAIKKQPDARAVVEKLNEIVTYADQHGVTHQWLAALDANPKEALLMAASAMPELSGAEGREYANQIVAWYLYSHGLGPDPLAPKPPPQAKSPAAEPPAEG